MGEPIRFEARSDGNGTWLVWEEGQQHTNPHRWNAGFLDMPGIKHDKPIADRAKAYAAHLTEWHKGGRIPQATCSLGHACDAGRYFGVPADCRPENRRAMVLCPPHAARFPYGPVQYPRVANTYTVTTCRFAKERVVYQGSDETMARSAFDGLMRWKRRGVVYITGPNGLGLTHHGAGVFAFP